MSRVAHMAQLACLSFALAACSDDGGEDLGRADAATEDSGAPDATSGEDTGVDGSVDAGPLDSGDELDAGSGEDAGPDFGPKPADFGELFGSCITDEDCGASDGICRRAEDGYPLGYCTRPCDGFNDRTACEQTIGGFTVYHHCYDRPEVPEQSFTCEFNCLNGLDCGRDGYTCQVNALPTGGLCIPVCSSDEQCGWGTFCNRYTGECQAEPPPDPTTEGLSVTGEACASDNDCASGTCITDGTFSQPNGWVQGYCVQDCILPSGYNNNDFFAGSTLPQGTCPAEGNVCIPVNPRSQSRQDLGVCQRGCVDETDCREGYACLRRIGTKLFENGICRPGTCGRGGTVLCPDTHTCVRVNTTQGPSNICAPNP